MSRSKPIVPVLGVVLVASLAALYWRRPVSYASPPSTATVLSQPQQVIKGWGCYPCTFQPDRPDADNFTIFHRPNATRLIFDLGFDILRCNILPHSYDAHKNDGSLDTRYLDASLVRQLRLGKQHGVRKYLLTVWSPPAVFKAPPTTMGQDAQTHKPAILRPDHEDAYCRYVVKVLDYLTKKHGFPKPVAYSIQNEPGFASPLWDGVPYPVAQWQRVFKKMRHALDAGGYRDVPLVGPEAGSYSHSVAFVGGPGAPTLQKDAELRGAMAGFAYHGYTFYSRKSPYPQQLRAVAQVAQALGKDVWMTEWSIIAQQRTPLDHALEVAQRLGREMAYIPSNYWFWWQGWYYQHPKGEVLITGLDDNHLHISKSYYVLRKLWHSVPVGSVVKRVQSNDADIKGLDPYAVQTVAFDSGDHMTMLLVNPTRMNKPLRLRGLSGQSAMPFLTDQTRDMSAQKRLLIKGGEAHIQLPPRSIILVIAR